jgi:hypothetical protein
MSASEDVSNLFRKFGGQPDQYQELSRESQAEESKARWPLLSSLQLDSTTAAPSVKDGHTLVNASPVPNLQGQDQPVGGAPFAPPQDEPLAAGAERARTDLPELPHNSTMGRSLFKKNAVPRPARDVSEPTLGAGGISGFNTNARADAVPAPVMPVAAVVPVAPVAPAPVAPAAVAAPEPEAPVSVPPVTASSSLFGRRPAAPKWTPASGILGKAAVAAPSQAAAEPVPQAASPAAAPEIVVPAASVAVPAAPAVLPVASSQSSQHGPTAGLFTDRPKPLGGLAALASRATPPAVPQTAPVADVTNAPAADDSKQLSSIFSRIAGTPVRPTASAQQKTSLFARLSRL